MAKCSNCGYTVSDSASYCPNCKASFGGGGSGAVGALLGKILILCVTYFPIIFFALFLTAFFREITPAFHAKLLGTVQTWKFGHKKFLGKEFYQQAPAVLAWLISIVFYILVRILAVRARVSRHRAWIPFHVIEFIYIASSYSILGYFVGRLVYGAVPGLFLSGKPHATIPQWMPETLRELVKHVRGSQGMVYLFMVMALICIVLTVMAAWNAWRSGRQKDAGY